MPGCVPTANALSTDSEHDAVLRRWPDGHFDTVGRDPRLVWADGIFATQHSVYVIAGQWERLPSFNHGENLRRSPYLLLRFDTRDNPIVP